MQVQRSFPIVRGLTRRAALLALAVAVAVPAGAAPPPHGGSVKGTNSSSSKPAAPLSPSTRTAPAAGPSAGEQRRAGAPPVHRRYGGGRRYGNSRPATNSIPSAPAGLTAAREPNGSVRLSWTTTPANKSGGDAFEVGRRLPSEKEFTRLGETRTGSFTDKGAGTTGGAVEYRVVTRRGGRYSGYSAVFSAPPAAPAATGTGAPVRKP